MAEDLSKYEVADIAKGLEQIGMRVRAEGETAFPDVPTMLREVGSIVGMRRNVEHLAEITREQDEAIARSKREREQEAIDRANGIVREVSPAERRLDELLAKVKEAKPRRQWIGSTPQANA